MQKSFLLPPLPYSLEALEPIISREILDLHYNKHHKAYVTNLLAALEKLEKTQDLVEITLLEASIAFNGGGHFAHSLFWESLAPKEKEGGIPPKGALLQAIQKAFGSFDKLLELLKEQSVAVMGSGWGWLACDEKTKALHVMTTQNHSLPQAQKYTPLLCLDVWEHAYYLQYKNNRAEFLKQILQILDWKKTSERYEKILST